MWSCGLVDIPHVDGKHSSNPSVLHVRDEFIHAGMAWWPVYRPCHAILIGTVRCTFGWTSWHCQDVISFSNQLKALLVWCINNEWFCQRLQLQPRGSVHQSLSLQEPSSMTSPLVSGREGSCSCLFWAGAPLTLVVNSIMAGSNHHKSTRCLYTQQLASWVSFGRHLDLVPWKPF